MSDGIPAGRRFVRVDLLLHGSVIAGLDEVGSALAPKEARRISDALYHRFLADAQADERGPGAQMGATTKINAADPAPTVDSSIKPQPGPGPLPKSNPVAARAP